MAEPQQMPNALQVARAVAQVLRKKLAVFGAEEIMLTREEAALCSALPKA